MSEAEVVFSVEGPTLNIELNRPERLNALNPALIVKLTEALERARGDDVRVVLLSGKGRAFCAGGDVKLFAEHVGGAGDPPIDMIHQLHTMIRAVRELPKPVVALVHGACAGAGLSLALACDMVLASEDAKLNTAYVGIGLSPDGGSTWALPRHVGLKKAAELFLTLPVLSAAEAKDLGLVNKVVPADALKAEGKTLASGLALGPTAAYGRVKRMLSASSANSLEEQLDLEARMVEESLATEDFRAGVLAFASKGLPEFKGR